MIITRFTKPEIDYLIENCAFTKDERLLFEKDGGHGMIFSNYDGEVMFIQHSPNNSPYERPCLFKIVEKDDTLYIAE